MSLASADTAPDHREPPPNTARAGTNRRLGWAALLVLAVIGAGGYVQVARGDTFWTGRIGAFPTIYMITTAALLQFALFLSYVVSRKPRGAYQATQIVVLPFLILGLCQVFWWHPISFLFLLAAGGIPVAAARAFNCDWAKAAPIPAFGVAALILLGAMTAIVQIPLVIKGAVVSAPWLIGAVAFGGLAAVFAVRDIAARFGAATDAAVALPMLPLSFLLFAVLRAKFPDTSYDAWLYKATLPMQMADWHSGGMPIMNAMMLGTTFQEMMNAALIMVTRDYAPPLISLISFALLFCIAPLAFALPRGARGRELAIAAFAAGMAYTVTEAGIGQGTSYQEPLQLVLLAAALLPGSTWPAFLAMATMVKINSGFLAPLILLLHLQDGWRHVLTVRTCAVAIAALLLVVAPQFERNVVYSGRLLGQSEVLADLTDPPGPQRIMVKGGSHFDGPVRGGPLNNAIMSACNMWVANVVCPTAYNGSDVQGFHVFPSSRAPLFAVVLCLLLLIHVAMRGAPPGTTIASVAAFALAYYLLVDFMSEARYFLPLSFGFAVLLLINRTALAAIFFDVGMTPRHWLAITAIAVFLLGSDLVPGMYTNVSWDSRRSLFHAAERQDLAAPLTPVQAFLERRVGDYRRQCPPPGLPPVLLGEHGALQAPYLGAEQSHFFLTHQMNDRFYDADPSRRAALPKAVLAFTYVQPQAPAQILGSAVSGFAACFSDGEYHVLCSKDLAPAGPNCAESLFPK